MRLIVLLCCKFFFFFCLTIHILWSVGLDLHLKGSYAMLGFVETKDDLGFWIRPESNYS
jgi:hypothetical protein